VKISGRRWKHKSTYAIGTEREHQLSAICLAPSATVWQAGAEYHARITLLRYVSALVLKDVCMCKMFCTVTNSALRNVLISWS
jgi:hypothetical protein